ncbi:MAG: hypothetical protein QME68_00695 [Elusimicrobiota bacterium]|nr:hypothetical protein [Elusimicrobiota bacterium]
MDERILLLMEETGCEQGEAELALQLSNYDFEKAIRTIKTSLRNIAIVKGKFSITEQNLYGIFVSIFDTNSLNLIRVRSVVSYNPAVYEIDLKSDWHTIEKAIYSMRLLEGSVQNLTREFELHFSSGFSRKKDKFYKALTNKSHQEICEVLVSEFPLALSKFQINTEEINLAEYQQEKKIEEQKDSRQSLIDTETKRLYLEAKLLEEKRGKKVNSLSQGEVVLSKIIDERETAKYLSRLLTSKETDYIPVPIEEIERTKEGITIKLYFTSGIVGIAKFIEPKTRVKVIKDNPKPFWTRIFGIK